jgi:hypothetical protein
MRLTCPKTVSVLLVLSASHLGCSSTESAVDAPGSAGTSPATEAHVDGSDTESRPAQAPTPTAPEDSPQAPGPADVTATSTVYPAPHPRMPQIPRNGGAVLHDPVVVSVTFSGDPWAQNIKAFGEQVGSLGWWSTVHAGYGVGPARSGGYVAANEVPASLVTDADIQRWVTARIGDGTLPAPTDQTIYTLYYPQATTVTLSDGAGAAASCQVFLGYHSTINVTYNGQSVPIAYAVVNRCSSELDQLTVTASHELTEAATDPHPVDETTCGFVTLEDNAWTGLGGENGDMCAGVSAVSEGGFALTRVWNNVTAAAGDQPCQPAPDTGGVPYYNAGIVQEVLAVAPGGSASTEVDCYAFGPLSAAIALDARVEGKAPVQISLSAKTCTNGDKVTLTATASARAQRGGDHRYALFSSLGPKSAHVWRGLVRVQ